MQRISLQFRLVLLRQNLLLVKVKSCLIKRELILVYLLLKYASARKIWIKWIFEHKNSRIMTIKTMMTIYGWRWIHLHRPGKAVGLINFGRVIFRSGQFQIGSLRILIDPAGYHFIFSSVNLKKLWDFLFYHRIWKLIIFFFEIFLL